MPSNEPGLNHLLIQGYAQSKVFNRGGGGSPQVRPVNRGEHGLRLKQAAKLAFQACEQNREALPLSEELRATGTVITLEGEEADCPLKLDSLSRRTSEQNSKPKWMLLSARAAEQDTPERATVWVSDEYRQDFLKLFADYLDDTKNTKNGKPSNQELVANISRIRQGILEDLWTSSSPLPPRGVKCWWEVWLDATSPQVDNWQKYVKVSGLKEKNQRLRLNDRLIVWVETSREQVQTLLFSAVPITELRQPEFIDMIADLSPEEKDDYVLELAERTVPAPGASPAVCVLDTGVLYTHELLQHSLAPQDCHSIFGGSDTDVLGHGTIMAGLALYGDLNPIMGSSGIVSLHHRLESVRMWPGVGEKPVDPLDYGTATVTAVTYPEIASHERSRVFCLALSSDPDNPGEPSLWSAAVDALAVGTDITREGREIQLLSTPDPHSTRLFLVAAGNVARYSDDYRTNCVNSPIHDPAQAWNALTVGAYTEMTKTPTHPQYQGWQPVGEEGDISPHTSTSVYFDQNRWPIKPDICMEGGNALSDGKGLIEPRVSTLSLLSTSRKNTTALTTANATSAATAQAARLAALAMSRYPDYWPETIRGLLTHEAQWTKTMKNRLAVNNSKKARQNLLREFGWGVPTESSVLNSQLNAVTLVTQDSFVPFTGRDYSMPHFRLHSLPWPREILEDLGEKQVQLRITLSYFIEPSASRRGWRNKYAYASHGLRFDLQGCLETQNEFISRINREPRSSGDSTRAKDSQRWLLGERNRHLGSLHQDEWIGTGSELAHCHNIAVYPVGGWWKNNTRKDRRDLAIRYALITSLRTETENIDLYTPITTQLPIPVAVPVGTPAAGYVSGN